MWFLLGFVDCWLVSLPWRPECTRYFCLWLRRLCWCWRQWVTWLQCVVLARTTFIVVLAVFATGRLVVVRCWAVMIHARALTNVKRFLRIVPIWMKWSHLASVLVWKNASKSRGSILFSIISMFQLVEIWTNAGLLMDIRPYFKVILCKFYLSPIAGNMYMYIFCEWI